MVTSEILMVGAFRRARITIRIAVQRLERTSVQALD